MNLFSILNAPADTNGYYIAGYAIFFITMAIYIGVLYLRNRNLQQEYELLKELDEEA